MGLIAVLGFAAGCATTVVEVPWSSQAQMNLADFGPPPTEIDHIKIMDLIREEMVDPTRAQFLFATPQRCHMRIRGRDLFGWKLMVGVNPRNSHDGDHRFQPFAFFFDHGKVVARQGQFDIPSEPE